MAIQAHLGHIYFQFQKFTTDEMTHSCNLICISYTFYLLLKFGGCLVPAINHSFLETYKHKINKL